MGKNKIRVTVSASEQKKYGVCYETMDHTDKNTRKLCEEIIKRADEEMGFRPDDGRILVEAKKLRDGNVTLYLSRIAASKDENRYVGAVKFREINDVIDAARSVGRFASFPLSCSLYLHENTYYLTFEITAKRKTAEALRFTLLEYGEKSGRSREFLSQYAERIAVFS